MTKRRSFLTHLKDWWWLYGVGTVLCSTIVLWGNLPARVAAQEQKNTKQDDALVDLKGIASRLDGYIQGQQTTNQLLMQQQAPNAPAPAPWEFIKEDGDWQVFRDPEGTLQCCNGLQCNPKPKKSHCPS